MQARDYFPLGKAHGEAFCNRELESDWLLSNIKAGKQSLLLAPRRFGKSSLAEKVILASKLPAVTLNFNTCSDEHDIERIIKQGTSQLIGRALGPADKLMNSIKQYVTHLTPKISIGIQQAHLELSASQQSNSATNVEETLNLIDKLLIEKKRSAIMIFDEFQTVGLIAKGSGVEAAIRNAAQDMKQLSLIFSGSNRSLLQQMFEDEKRPLYKLCRKLRLKRIEENHYRIHLNKAARLAWKKKLEDAVFDRIMELSECHPYYVNYLCDVLWTENPLLPNLQDVNRAWKTVIDEESSDANAEIANLSMGQKKVIKHIANYSGGQLMSSDTYKILGMALSSIAGSISALIEKDLIEKENETYKIINPVIHWLLKESEMVS